MRTLWLEFVDQVRADTDGVIEGVKAFISRVMWKLGVAAALPVLLVGMIFNLTLKENVLSVCCFVLFVYACVGIVFLLGLLLGISLSLVHWVYDKTEKYHATAIKSFKIVLGMLLISLLLYIIVKYTCCVLAALIVFGMGSGGGRHEGASSVGAA